MPDHIEVETNELQEKIQEEQEEIEHLEKEESEVSWVRYVGLTTAIFAVFAAISALQSGSLINEAMIHQIKASDTWAEYQASREKDHLYSVALNGLVDANAANAAFAAALRAPARKPEPAGPKPAHAQTPKGSKGESAASGPAPVATAPKSAAARAVDYRDQIAEERGKEAQRMDAARKLEEDSAEELRRQRNFEFSVALIQVAIALGAVAALTRVKAGWLISMGTGAIGLVLFAWGFFG